MIGPARSTPAAGAKTADPLDLAKADSLLKTIGLPSMPLVVLNIFKEMREKCPSFSKIAKLAAQDPALVARILKIINSPYYGKGVPIKSVEHALALLGLDNFRKFIMVSALRESLAGGKPDALFQKIWFHSVTVARVAEYIAVWLRSTVSPDQAYLLGLFHDSAMNLIANKFPAYRAVLQDPEVDFRNLIEREEGIVGSHHAALGAMIARSFGIAEPIFQAIRHHHANGLADLPPFKDPNYWLILRLADYLAEYLCFKGGVPTLEFYSFEEGGHSLSPEILKEFNMTPAEFANLTEDVVDMVVLGQGGDF